MSHFWSSLFEHLKGCGQNATLFLVGLAGFLGLVVVAAIIAQSQLRQYVVAALPWLAVFLLVWTSLAIRRARARRRERWLRSPLSEDELSKARRRLGRHRDPG
jgi:cobalamin biosynthesis protein CobD/CbiB